MPGGVLCKVKGKMPVLFTAFKNICLGSLSSVRGLYYDSHSVCHMAVRLE